MEYERHIYLAKSKNGNRVNIDLFIKDGLVNEDISVGMVIDKVLRQEVQYAFAKSMGYAQNRYDRDLIDFIYDISQMSDIEERPFGIVNNWLKGESIGNEIFKRNEVNVDLRKGFDKLWCLILDLDGIVSIKDLLDLEPKLKKIFLEYNLFFRKSRSGKGLHVFIPLRLVGEKTYNCKRQLMNLFRYIKSLVMPLNGYFNHAISGNIKLSLFNDDKVKLNAFENIVNVAKKNGKLQKLSIDTKVLSLGRILFNSRHPVSFVVNRIDYPTVGEFNEDLRLYLGFFRNNKEMKENVDNVFIDNLEGDVKQCADLLGVKVERKRVGSKRKKEGKPILSNVKSSIQGLAHFIDIKQQEIEGIKKNDKDDETIKMVKEYNVISEINDAKKDYDNLIKSKIKYDEDGNVIGYYNHTRKIEDNCVVKLSKRIEKINSFDEKEKDNYKKSRLRLLKNTIKNKDVRSFRRNFGEGYCGLLSIFTDLSIPYVLYGNYFQVSVSPNENSSMDLYHYFYNKDAWFLQSKNSYRHFDDINKLITGKDELTEEDYCENRYCGIILNVMGKGRQKHPIIKMKYFPMMLWQIFKNWGYDFTIEECIWLTMSLGLGYNLMKEWKLQILQGFVDALEYAIETGNKEVRVGAFVKCEVSGKEKNAFMAGFMEYIEKVSGGLFKVVKKFGNTAFFELDEDFLKQITNLDKIKRHIDERVEQEFQEYEKYKQGIDCNKSLAMRVKGKIELEKEAIEKEITKNFGCDVSQINDLEDDVLTSFEKYVIKQREYFNYIENNLHKLDKRFLVSLYAVGQLMNLKSRFLDDYITELHKLGNQNPIYFWIEMVMSDRRFWKIRQMFWDINKSFDFKDNFILKQNQEQKRVFYRESKMARETFK